LTLLDTITFPTASSGVLEAFVTIIDENVLGNDLRSATNIIAVIISFNPTRQPNMAATSRIIAVRIPMNISEIKNVNQPPAIAVGGTKANRIYLKKRLNNKFEYIKILPSRKMLMHDQYNDQISLFLNHLY
jgi:hypothetical protein